MQQQQHHFIDRRRPQLMDASQKTKNEEFYAKLERIRLATAAASSKQCSQRSATELLDASKAFFVKSEEVLHNRQTFFHQRTSNEPVRMTPSFRIAQPRRSPYLDYEHDRIRVDFPLRSSTPPLSTSNFSDSGAFESVSLLSLSDQMTLDSANSPSNVRRTVVPSTSLTVIERNARIIKWLFQLNKANSSSCSSSTNATTSTFHEVQ